MTQRDIVLSKLVQVSEKEWLVAMAKCREHIKLKLKNKTLTGAHSEAILKMPAPDYYFTHAVQKLYEVDGWIWQFEKFDLIEQLVRIINSMISEQVRKYKVEKNKIPVVASTENETDFDSIDDSLTKEEIVEREKAVDEFLKITEAAISGDEDLEILFLHLMDKKEYSEIAVEMNRDIKKIYKLAERMKEKVRNYATDNKKSN